MFHFVQVGIKISLIYVFVLQGALTLLVVHVTAFVLFCVSDFVTFLIKEVCITGWCSVRQYDN